MKYERAIWMALIAGVVALIVLYWRTIESSTIFIAYNPAFPLYKTSSSSAYAVGIMNSVGLSLLRVIVGSLSGFAVGCSIGVLTSQLRYLGPRVYGILLLFAPVAPLVWLPALLKVTGLGNTTAFIVVAAGSVFIDAVVVYYLCINCRPGLLQMVRSMGGDRWQIVRHVVVPSLVPMLSLLLRINLFSGWAALLAGEMAGTNQGLGVLLMLGRALGNWSMIAFATALIVLIAFALDRFVSHVGFFLVRTRFGAWVFTAG